MSIRVKDNSVTFKTFKPDDYYAVTGMREEYKTSEPDDRMPGTGIHNGKDWIVVSEPVITPDGSGIVSGIAMEDGDLQPFARVNGRLYHVSVLKRG